MPDEDIEVTEDAIIIHVPEPAGAGGEGRDKEE